MPGEHPGLKKVVITLSLVILVSSIWALWPEATTSVEYRNAQYGFAVALPASWDGFSVTDDPQEMLNGDEAPTSIPVIHIAHPLATAGRPRQDIPIMVFTLEQWSMIEQGLRNVGAAPIPPSELARNASYVFALPARYNYSFLEGFEEVDQLLQSGIVSAF